KARFFHFAFQFLKAMETIHFHYIYGLMDESIWRGWGNLYKHYLASPGILFYWNLRHDLFSERFQDFVAGLDRPAQRLTVANLLGQEKVDKYTRSSERSVATKLCHRITIVVSE